MSFWSKGSCIRQLLKMEKFKTSAIRGGGMGWAGSRLSFSFLDYCFLPSRIILDSKNMLCIWFGLSNFEKYSLHVWVGGGGGVVQNACPNGLRYLLCPLPNGQFLVLGEVRTFLQRWFVHLLDQLRNVKKQASKGSSERKKSS